MAGKKTIKVSIARDWPQIRDDFPLYVEKIIAKHGDIFFLDFSLFGLPVGGFHHFSHPTHIKHVLFENHHNYIKMEYVFKVFQDVLGDYGVLTTNNYDIWHRERDLLNPSFSKEIIKKYALNMIETIDSSLDTWAEYEKSHTPMNLDEVTLKMTYDILSKTLLNGIQIEFSTIREMLGEMLSLASKAYRYYGVIPKPWITARFKKLTKKMQDFSAMLVEQSLATRPEDGNVIRILADGYEKLNIPPEEQKISLEAEALTMVVAGHETTATTIAHAFAYLSMFPWHAEKIREEVTREIGNRKPTFDDLSRFNYVHAVMKETMRLKPPFTFLARTAKEDDRIGQYEIKKGENILLSLHHAHRIPEYWENPEGFNPERFLTPLDERYKFIYMPFGLGPRSCIGQHFAMMEAIFVLVMTAQRYQLYLTSHSTLNIEIYSVLNKLNREVTMTVHSTANQTG